MIKSCSYWFRRFSYSMIQDRQSPGQVHIYYMNGNNIKTLNNSQPLVSLILPPIQGWREKSRPNFIPWRPTRLVPHTFRGSSEELETRSSQHSNVSCPFILGSPCGKSNCKLGTVYYSSTSSLASPTPEIGVTSISFTIKTSEPDSPDINTRWPSGVDVQSCDINARPTAEIPGGWGPTVLSVESSTVKSIGKNTSHNNQVYAGELVLDQNYFICQCCSHIFHRDAHSFPMSVGYVTWF